MVFINPFNQGLNTDTDDPDVVVPMDQAPRHPMNILKAKQVMAESNNSLSIAEIGNKEASSSGSSSTSASDSIVFSIECLRREVENDAAASEIDTYSLKSRIANIALQDIGMGRYNWQLFFLAGCGWFLDNAWLTALGIILTSLQREFEVPQNRITYTTMSMFIGLCIGAVVFGVSSDIWGRRIAFNTTLFIASIFGICLGFAPNWTTACGLCSALGVGVGGSLPVDGALFLEFLPYASGNILTMLSVFWPVGALVASMVAWIFIPNFACDTNARECLRSDNMGWRYLIWTMGGITFLMFFCRFFIFHLYESPKFLLSKGKDREAVAVLQRIAGKNRTKTWLTYDIMQEVAGANASVTSKEHKDSLRTAVKENLQKFSAERVKPLFSSKRLGISTALIWFCWATIGMAYPLFNAFLVIYLSRTGNGGEKSNSIVFRNYAITSLVGVPGSILACFTVDIPCFGRKGTMAISTMLTGVFVCLFTLSTESSYQLAFTSIEAFVQNISYGVLYAYTPEIFPAPNRGTGTGIASFLNRITGLCAPIIASHVIGNPKTPIFISAGLFLSAFIAMVLIPIETRGRQSL